MITTVVVQLNAEVFQARSVGWGDPRVLAAAEQMLALRPGVRTVQYLDRPAPSMFSPAKAPAWTVTLFEDEMPSSLMLDNLLVPESFRVVWTEDGGEKTELVALTFELAGMYL